MKFECKICGFEGKSLVGHLKKHDITGDEYKEKYNIDKIHFVSKKQKEHLSKVIKEKYENDEEYRNNVNNNRSSIWDINYWIEQGHSEGDAKKKVSEYQRVNGDKYRNKYTDKERRVHNRFCVEYWINQGYSKNEAKDKISTIQSKYSEFSSKFEGKSHSDGSKEKIANAMRNYINSIGKEKWVDHFGDVEWRSNGEIEIFNFVKNKLNINCKANYFIEDMNVDILVGDKVIEYFGDYWHAHSNLFEDNDMHPNINKTALQIRKKDECRINRLKKLGYDVFVVWEGEYNTNKMKIKKEIKNFLNDT